MKFYVVIKRLLAATLLATCFHGVTACSGGSSSEKSQPAGEETPVTISSINISSANSTLLPGDNTQLVVMATDSAGEQSDITASVSYQVSNALVSVSNAGLVSVPLSGAVLGQVLITATAGSISETVSIDVKITQADIQNMSLSTLPSMVTTDTPVQLIASATLTNGKTMDIQSLVDWFSSDVSVKFSNGNQAEFVTAGEYQLFARFDNQTTPLVLQVLDGNAPVPEPENPIVSVTIQNMPSTVKVGDVVELTAVVSRQDGALAVDTPISWSVTPSQTASINSSGKLTALAAGNITVTARASNISTTQTANIETDVPPEEEGQPDFRPLTFNPMVHDVLYFMLQDRFYNGNPSNDYGNDTQKGNSIADRSRHGFDPTASEYYHGGDLAGVEQKLDYLEGMGVTGVWLTPIFENMPTDIHPLDDKEQAGYHGYWIKDFYAVDPHLGTDEELASLVQAAHSRPREIKIILDIITNHTANTIEFEEGLKRWYRPKADYPYKDAFGVAFDETDFVNQANFPELNNDSFPYTPKLRSDIENVGSYKNPSWMNDLTVYHNRGNITDNGWQIREQSEHADFFNLDDLFTEDPVVVKGLIDIYRYWVEKFDIDAYRIDTVKLVNMEFWQEFSPGIIDYAASIGNPDFFMFGEVFDGDPYFVSQYSREGNLPANLDFPVAFALRGFASQAKATDEFKDMFMLDDIYIDADSNPYQLPTFLGNHDMGRIGYMIDQDNPSATESEKYKRFLLAHNAMFFVRGIPVIYYGDEQGFRGARSREDMLASQVASFNQERLFGSNKSHADENFDTNHPVYRHVKQLSEVFHQHEALRNGTQIQRWSTGSAGVFAISRLDRTTNTEYIVTFNNDTQQKSVTMNTYTPDAQWTQIYPANSNSIQSGNDGRLDVTVEGLGTVIYQANKPMPALSSAAQVSFKQPSEDSLLVGKSWVQAEIDRSAHHQISFYMKVEGQAPIYLGTDDNPPYRIYFDAAPFSDFDSGIMQIVSRDVAGRTSYAERRYSFAGDLSDATVHYFKQDCDYTGWGLHVWGNSVQQTTDWNAPINYVVEGDICSDGVVFKVPLKSTAEPMGFIIHKGNEKSWAGDSNNPNGDREADLSAGLEIWINHNDKNIYYSKP